MDSKVSQALMRPSCRPRTSCIGTKRSTHTSESFAGGVYRSTSTGCVGAVRGAEKVIDFGGAGCPLGLDSVVVDLLRWDAAGYEIKHHDIKAWNGRADLVFSSHCLEHFEDLDEALTDLGAALTSEGKAVLLLPAHTCERWRAGVHQNKNFNDHRWTFCLSGDLDVPEIEHLVVIDDKVAEYMVVETAEYCGDNSIYIVASRAPSSA